MLSAELEGVASTSPESRALLSAVHSIADDESGMPSSGSNNRGICCGGLSYVHILALCLMLLVSAIFGGYNILTHVALSGVALHPLAYALVRDLIATISLQSVSTLIEYRRPLSKEKDESGQPSLRRFFPDPEDRLQFLLVGFLGVWGAQACSALSLANLNPIIYTMLQLTQPCVTGTVAAILGIDSCACSERVTLVKILGMLTTVGGAVFVSYESGRDNASSSSSSDPLSSGNFGLGMVFLGLQLLLGGTYPITQRQLLQKYPSTFVTAWGYTYGLAILIVCTISSATKASDWAFTPFSLLAVLYAGCLASGFNYAVMAYCNQLVGPTAMMFCLPSVIASSLLLQYLFYGIVVSWSSAVGATIVVGGLFVFIGAESYSKSQGKMKNAVGTTASTKLQSVGAGNLQQPQESAFWEGSP